MTGRSLRRRVVVLLIATVLAATCAAGLPPYLQFRDYAGQALKDARERLEIRWEAERLAAIRETERIAARPEIARLSLLPPLSEDGREPVPPRPGGDVMVVVNDTGQAVASLDRLEWALLDTPQVARALSGMSASGLAAIDGTPVRFGVAPLRADGKAVSGAIVTGRRITPGEVAEWATGSGGTLSFAVAPPSPPVRDGMTGRILDRLGHLADLLAPPTRLTWQAAPGGAWVTLSLPLQLSPASLRGALAAAVSGLLLVVLVIGLLARRIARPIRAMENEVAYLRGFPRRPTGKRQKPQLPPIVNLSAPPPPAPAAPWPDEPCLILDRSGCITDANRHAEQLFDRDRDGLLSADMLDLLPDDEELRSTVYRHFIACLEGGTPRFETQIVRPGGTRVPVAIGVDLIPDTPSLAIRLILRDLTEQKHREAERAEAERLAGIGNFAGGMAHDFGNALGGILGYASLIKGLVPEDDRVHRYSDVIERSAERAAGMIRQLERLGKATEPHTQRLAVDPLLTNLTRSLAPGLAEAGITMDTHPSADSPEVLGDEEQLTSVLRHLCENARAAMPDGGLLRLASETVTLPPPKAGGQATPDTVSLPPGRYVRLTVSDTGCGMDEDTLKRIFEPYFSARPEAAPGSTAGHAPGTGLGLTVAWAVIHAHGGEIRAASRPGQGTTMQIHLPAASPETGEGTEENPLGLPVSVRVGSGTVLVADGDPHARREAAKILEDAGYPVRTAADGEALERIVTLDRSISLVVLDAGLPKQGGLAGYHTIHAIRPELPVIAASPFSRHGQAHDLLEAGADGFVNKPYRASLLMDGVAAFLAPTHPSAPAG